MRVGQRVKELRKAAGLRQKELGEKAGVTPSLISQIEGDRVSPSLGTLRKLADALDVHVSDFLDDRLEGRIKVVRKAEHGQVTFDANSERWTILAAGIVGGRIRAAVLTLAPRQESSVNVVLEPGQMKLGYVIRGEITLTYDGQKYHMAAGDSAYLDGGVNHTWSNPGDQVAKVLWVITDRRL